MAIAELAHVVDQSPDDVIAEAEHLLAEDGPAYTGLVRGGSAPEAGR